MKLAIIIIAIGAAIYYALYGNSSIEGLRKESSQAGKAEEQRSFAALKAQYWRASYRSPANCQDPRTELKKLECKNAEDNARQAFDRKWEADIARGWKPAQVGK